MARRGAPSSGRARGDRQRRVVQRRRCPHGLQPICDQRADSDPRAARGGAARHEAAWIAQGRDHSGRPTAARSRESDQRASERRSRRSQQRARRRHLRPAHRHVPERLADTLAGSLSTAAAGAGPGRGLAQRGRRHRASGRSARRRASSMSPSCCCRSRGRSSRRSRCSAILGRSWCVRTIPSPVCGGRPLPVTSHTSRSSPTSGAVRKVSSKARWRRRVHSSASSAGSRTIAPCSRSQLRVSAAASSRAWPSRPISRRAPRAGCAC